MVLALSAVLLVGALFYVTAKGRAAQEKAFAQCVLKRSVFECRELRP